MIYNLAVLPTISATISVITSQVGISGAFLLLPVQVSLLGIESPVASSTNLFYNVVSTPGGIYRHWREGRLNPRLTVVILSGTIPGMFTGVYVRSLYLPNPRAFKIFAGTVLLAISLRLLFSRRSDGKPEKFEISEASLSFSELRYRFDGKVYRVRPLSIAPLAYAIGVVAGAYGVGGGAFLAPVLVSFFALPVYTISGSVLLSTFVTSCLSALLYSLLGYPPNLAVGLLFGLGGMAGSYAGTRAQRLFPEKAIRLILGVIVGVLALRYISFLALS